MIALIITPRLTRYLNQQRMSSIWMNVASATLLQVRDGVLDEINSAAFEVMKKRLLEGWWGIQPPYTYVTMDSGLRVWPEPQSIQETKQEPELPNPRKGLRQIEV